MMQKFWANFAKNGNPNGTGLSKWPPYTASDGWPVMILSAEPAAHKDDLRDRYLFLSTEWKSKE
jgi:para-nitrobenzyl esterase